MGVDVQNFYYHRTLHHELLSDLGFLNLSAAATGVYFRLRLMAAITNNSGSIQMGSIRMTREALLDFISSSFKFSKREASKIITELQGSGHVLISPAGVVRLPKYLEEQHKAPSKAAEKKRAQRERGKGFASPGPGPLPPPAQCSVSDQFQVGDMSPYKKGTCPPITERLRTESITSVNLNTDAETETSARDPRAAVSFGSGSVPFGPEAGWGRGPGPGEAFSNPVMVACDLCQEFDHRSVNVWNDWIAKLQAAHGHELGLDLFCHGLNVLRQKINSRGHFKTAPSAYLQGVLKKLLHGGHP